MDAEEFEWESQLRFYWMKSVDNLIIQQCSGKCGRIYGLVYTIQQGTCGHNLKKNKIPNLKRKTCKPKM